MKKLIPITPILLVKILKPRPMFFAQFNEEAIVLPVIIHRLAYPFAYHVHKDIRNTKQQLQSMSR